jgi:hypothetical protein
MTPDAVRVSVAGTLQTMLDRPFVAYGTDRNNLLAMLGFVNGATVDELTKLGSDLPASREWPRPPQFTCTEVNGLGTPLASASFELVGGKGLLTFEGDLLNQITPKVNTTYSFYVISQQDL